MATGDRNYNIAKETTSQEILTAVNEISFSVIKSIQRGVISDKSYEVTVNINKVNPDKCMVILNGGISDVDNSYSQNILSPYLVSLTDTTLTVNVSGAVDKMTTTVSWQVIEFN